MTKGQRAMAVAMLLPEPERTHPGKKRSRNGNLSDVASNRVAEARAVLAYRPVAAPQMREFPGYFIKNAGLRS